MNVLSQIELIVAMHDLLAEYGLCCANGDGEVEEGTFLKRAIKHLLSLDMKLKSNFNNSSDRGLETMQCEDQLSHDNHDKTSVDKSTSDTGNVATAAVNFSMDQSDIDKEEKANSQFKELDSELIEDEREELESAIDNALDQCFFCLYGLNLRSDSSYEDDVVLHKNCSRGDYQTKEQCADVFQYILPYAKASSVSGFSAPLLLITPVSLYFPFLLELIIC